MLDQNLVALLGREVFEGILNCTDRLTIGGNMRTLLVSALCLFLLANLAQAQNERPDVLFISIDDLNDWVGPLGGHPQSITPNLDALAERGMTFTNAHTAAALCNPSRTSLMLGLYPSTTGIYGNSPNWQTVPRLADLPTIPRNFKDHGYHTTGAGKLFHAATFNAPLYYGYNDQSAWSDFYPSLDRQLPDEITPHDRPQNNNPFSPNLDWGSVEADDRAMADGQVVAWSADQISASMDQPRFNAIGIYRPHLPWYVPQKYLDMHPLEDIVLPEFAEDDLEDIPEAGINIYQSGQMPPREFFQWAKDSGEWQAGVQAYLASVTFADAMVGQIIEALDQSGRADNTIIVLWSDHGWHLGEKHWWRKQTLWEEATRVPLIIVAPGLTEPGSSSQRAVSLMDIYPTLMELTGLEAPEYLEGHSLLPLIENPAAQWDHIALSTFGFQNHAIRSEHHRYIRYADGSEELYDHRSDPNEWHNLASNPDYAEIKAELRQRLPAENAPDEAN